MTKTIKELANQYAVNWEAKHNIHNPELYDLIVDAYKASAERMMSLPLAQRLTAEEKERMRAIYNRKRYGTEYSKEVEWMEKQLLEHLLGADFFKEGE